MGIKEIIKEKFTVYRPYVISSVVMLLVGLVTGRYLAPEKVQVKIQEKIVTKTVVKWKTKYVKSQKNDKETIIVETKYPDGTIKREKRIIDRGTLQVDLTKEGSKSDQTTVSKDLEYAKTSARDWHVSLLATNTYPENNVLSDNISYGIHAERRIIGPFYVGVYGTTNKNYGLSLGYDW